MVFAASLTTAAAPHSSLHTCEKGQSSKRGRVGKGQQFLAGGIRAATGHRQGGLSMVKTELTGKEISVGILHPTKTPKQGTGIGYPTALAFSLLTGS